MKTGKQIQGDVYRLLAASQLATQLSGHVYRDGYRPRDSRLEDATVTFTAGTPGDIPTGIVTVNIYVPDIDPDGDGTWVEDGQRTEEIERLAASWVDGLTADVSSYLFRLQDTIRTEAEPDIRQHFVTIRLKYRYCGDDTDPIFTDRQQG